MAAIGVGSKYHCAINGVGYLLGQRGYQKKDAPVFTPRFGTGEQGLNDLELLKSWAQDDFSGGQFQEDWDDITKTSQLRNIILNPYDKLLYPTMSAGGVGGTTVTGAVLAGVPNVVSAWYKGVLYYAANGDATHGGVYKLNSTPNASAVKTDFANNVTGMATVKGILWVATGNLFWSYDGTTWTSHTGAGFIHIVAFNGKIYGDGLSSVGILHVHNAVVGTNSVAPVDDIGDKYYQINDLVVYNSRLYMGKPDGLFAYDGTLVTTVLDYSDSINTNNFSYLVVFRGNLYFTLRNGISKFSGATVEKIKEFAIYETIQFMGIANDRLHVCTTVATAYTDKAATNDNFVYSFDGIGWFNYYYYNSSTSLRGFYYVPDLQKMILVAVDGITGFLIAQTYLDMSKEYQAVSSNVAYIYSSIFDAGFPNISKYFDTVTVNYENIAASDSIEVQSRTFDGATWSSFQSLGTITSASTGRTLKLYETAYSGSFKKVQLKFIITRTSTSNLAFRNFYMNYYIAPTPTWQWQLKLLSYGNSDTPLQLADNATNETKTPAELRENIYNSRASLPPVAFEDIDFNQLNGAVNSSVTTLTVDSTKAFRSYGYIKIDDEIIKYTGKTATTLTGCTRAALGTSAASHADNAIVNMYYRVIIKSIDSESVIVPNQDVQGQESDLTITLQEAPWNA